MKARDVMVSPVVTVGENEIGRDAAKLLIEKRISAVPVVDGAGKLIGIITEADLLHRAEAGTERPVSWWLSLISGDRALADEYRQVPREEGQGRHDARRQNGRARYAAG
jgi:CBS-domain-containing membrane protein